MAENVPEFSAAAEKWAEGHTVARVTTAGCHALAGRELVSSVVGPAPVAEGWPMTGCRGATTVVPVVGAVNGVDDIGCSMSCKKL
jgi:hypothetical protein